MSECNHGFSGTAAFADGVPCPYCLQEQVAQLTKERDDALDWVEKHLNTAKGSCHHCGWEGDRKPIAECKAEIEAHVLACDKHPIRAVEKERNALRELLSKIVSESVPRVVVGYEPFSSLYAAVEGECERGDSDGPLERTFHHEMYDLLTAINDVHSQHADDLCWMPADVNRIFVAAGLPPQDLRVGDKAAMLRNCERYVSCLQEGGPWKSYVELESEVARLKAREAEWGGLMGMNAGRIVLLKQRVEKLQLFKDWVHTYLDSHGVPKEFPDGPHTKEGCRIGDRMDWLWSQVEGKK